MMMSDKKGGMIVNLSLGGRFRGLFSYYSGLRKETKYLW